MSALVIELQVPDLHAYGSHARPRFPGEQGVSSSGGNYGLGPPPELPPYRDGAASTWRLSERCHSRRPRNWTRRSPQSARPHSAAPGAGPTPERRIAGAPFPAFSSLSVMMHTESAWRRRSHRPTDRKPLRAVSATLIIQSSGVFGAAQPARHRARCWRPNRVGYRIWATTRLPRGIPDVQSSDRGTKPPAWQRWSVTRRLGTSSARCV